MKPATFNVHDFGAVGDGEHDDGPAIQKAINAAFAAGEKYVETQPGKTYRLKGSLNGRNVTLRPEGHEESS